MNKGNWGKIRAFFDLQTEEGFTIKGFKIIEGINGLFVGTPSQKGKDDEYFDKIKKLGFINKYTAQDGINELIPKLESGEIDKTDETITLKWYETLEYWQQKINYLEIKGKLLKL